MNIFFTSDSPQDCAMLLDDKRVVKMCLETTQMLFVAFHEYMPNITKRDKSYFYEGIKIYGKTHVNHPSTVWVRTSRENYIWTLNHLKALLSEYTKRYEKIHACSKFVDLLETVIPNIPSLGMTKKPNCASNKSLGICYKHINNIYQAYQHYLNDRWELDKREPKWNGVKAK